MGFCESALVCWSRPAGGQFGFGSDGAWCVQRRSAHLYHVVIGLLFRRWLQRECLEEQIAGGPRLRVSLHAPRRLARRCPRQAPPGRWPGAARMADSSPVQRPVFSPGEIAAALRHGLVDVESRPALPARPGVDRLAAGGGGRPAGGHPPRRHGPGLHSNPPHLHPGRHHRLARFRDLVAGLRDARPRRRGMSDANGGGQTDLALGGLARKMARDHAAQRVAPRRLGWRCLRVDAMARLETVPGSPNQTARRSHGRARVHEAGGPGSRTRGRGRATTPGEAQRRQRRRHGPRLRPQTDSRAGQGPIPDRPARPAEALGPGFWTARKFDSRATALHPDPVFCRATQPLRNLCRRLGNRSAGRPPLSL